MIPAELAALGVISWTAEAMREDAGGVWYRRVARLADGRIFGATLRGPEADCLQFVVNAIRYSNEGQKCV